MTDGQRPSPTPEDVWTFLLAHQATIEGWFPRDLRDDGFQEVLLRMLKRADNLRARPNEGGADILQMQYVRAVARSVVNSNPRKWKLAQLPEAANAEGEMQEVELAAEPTVDRFAMREALLQLRPVVNAAQWQSLMLTALYGLESKQAAAILLTTANAIDLRTSRARERIREAMPTLGHFGAGDAKQVVLVRENGEMLESPIAPRPVPVFVPGEAAKLRVKAFAELDGPLGACTALAHVAAEDGELRSSAPSPVRIDASGGAVWELEFVPRFVGKQALAGAGEVEALFLFEGEWLLAEEG